MKKYIENLLKALVSSVVIIAAVVLFAIVSIVMPKAVNFIHRCVRIGFGIANKQLDRAVKISEIHTKNVRK